MGNIAYQVYTLSGGMPVAVLTSLRQPTEVGGFRLSVTGGKLIRTSARYSPSDPLCCPSLLIQTTYRWNGSSLEVEREVELPATPGPKAAP
jgi:hypothetical protein